MIIFKAVTADATQYKSFSQAYCESKTHALVHLSIQEAFMFVHHRVL